MDHLFLTKKKKNKPIKLFPFIKYSQHLPFLSIATKSWPLIKCTRNWKNACWRKLVSRFLCISSAYKIKKKKNPKLYLTKKEEKSKKKFTCKISIAVWLVDEWWSDASIVRISLETDWLLLRNNDGLANGDPPIVVARWRGDCVYGVAELLCSELLSAA